MTLHLEQSVERFTKNSGHIDVHLKSGQNIPADIVILSIGVRPETTLARDAGLRIGETGGIWVTNTCRHLKRTSMPWATPSSSHTRSQASRGSTIWLIRANRQGRLVADNMVSGNIHKYEGAIGTAIAKVFDLTVASTGLAAKKLKQLDISYRSSWDALGLPCRILSRRPAP